MGNSHAERTVPKNDLSTSRAPTGDALLFARNFFRHPRMLGSIIPSSRFLIKQLLQPIDWDKARVIVEYGPGVGGITAEILRRMRPDARLIAIETNPEFVAFLRAVARDERLHVTEGSAAVGQGDPARPRPLQGELHHLRDSARHACPGQSASRSCAIPARRSSRAAPSSSISSRRASCRICKRFFRYVKRKFEPLNVLPAHLFFCQPGTA